MVDINKETDGPTPFSSEAYDIRNLPDYDQDFITEEELAAFVQALAAPENRSTHDGATSPVSSSPSVFITALNDWRPVRQRVRSKKKKRRPRRGRDETREGFVYTLLKWPLLLSSLGWLALLGLLYLFTRLYIYLYEHFIAWRGHRQRLRADLRRSITYEDWVARAKELDAHLGNDAWKQDDEYAYYDSGTIKDVRQHMMQLRERAEKEEMTHRGGMGGQPAIEELRGLLEACVKNNFAGSENPHLYSESYYGTKELVQSYVNEVAASLDTLSRTSRITQEDKRAMFKQLYNNFGRSALCLSGGATFAYYHFGVAKALLDANLLPDVITGTSGGALVAALLCTRTDEELKNIMVPALAHRITACHDDIFTWFKRWWLTGARFDAVDWAKRCSWFTRGSMTFREAYLRTGRVLNVTCVPSDPYSPTILANYLTSPDCVIWSAVLASAAVPGILNPVVLMKKLKDGTLAPFSFGHKWKDGSLRTDIPLGALNLHFNVNFSIVSQVNPHINLFFFSSRGSVGRPVSHRRGRGWRGGFLGSALEQYLKLEMTKWLKVLRHLELLPRPLGQDWSEIWLQRFSGTITIWPRSKLSDFYHILSDPTPQRLARMIHVGQLSTFSKLNFIANRIAVERPIEKGRRATRPVNAGGLANILSEEDLQGLLTQVRKRGDPVASPYPLSGDSSGYSSPGASPPPPALFQPMYVPSKTPPPPPRSPSLSDRITGWWNKLSPAPSVVGHPREGEPEVDATSAANGVRRSRRSRIHSPAPRTDRPVSMFEVPSAQAADFYSHRRQNSILNELKLQSRVFIDDYDDDDQGQKGVLSDEDKGVLSDEEVKMKMKGKRAIDRFLGPGRSKG